MKKYAFFLLLLACVTNTFAQSSNQGALTGRVTDANGGVLPGARITARNLATGVTRSVTSDEQGNYRVDFLLPGEYELEGEATGFNKLTISPLTVHVAELQRVDLRFTVGAVTAQVTVSDVATNVNTENPTVGEVINERSIQNLPLNGREFIQLAGLVPGAETNNAKRGAVDSKDFVVGFNGARSTTNAFFVDGADSTDANNNQLISSPSLDSIKEFRVETNLYSARYGRAGGGVINVVTKSGGNQFHGSLYNYHRNKALDARPFFYTGTRENQPSYLFNQFGGSVGGPIRRNKTFFFTSLEYFRQKKPGELIETFAPTALERAGDYTKTINPYSNRAVVLRNPFTGQNIASNILPANLINPVGKRLMDLWPEPNYTGDPFLNLRVLRSGTYNQDKWLTRIDHQFSERMSLMGSFNWGDYDNTSARETVYSDTKTLQYDRALALSLTRTINSHLVNDVKFSYTDFRNGTDFTLNDKNYAKEWGLWTGNAFPDLKGTPRVLFYTISSRIFSLGGAGPNVRNNRNLYLRDDLVWVRGKHTLTLGGEFKRQSFDWNINNSTLGTFNFGFNDGLATQNANYQTTGTTFAQVLMGVSARATYDVTDGQFANMRRNQFAAYAQDDWKVSSRLTLNLGLRYDYDSPFFEANNRFMTLNYQTGAPRYAAGAPADRLALLKFKYETGGPNRPYEPGLLHFAPRIGLAWRPFNDNRTAIRGGYGLVYTSESAFTTTYGSFVVPFGGTFIYLSRGPNWPDRVDHFVTVDQTPYRLTDKQGDTPGTIFPTTSEYPLGYVQHWNFAVTRDLGWGTGVEVAYVGSKGTNLNGLTTTNDYMPGLLAKMQANVPGWANQTVRTKGFNSKYNALQLKANRRFSNGLQFLAAFTWAHSMAEASNDAINENTVPDIDEIGPVVRRAYSNADHDIRKRFSLSGRYELPFGRGKTFGKSWNGFVNSILGGWSSNFIFQLQDGRPFSVRTTGNRVPNRICDGNLPASERTADRWFNPSCFTDPVARSFTRPDGTTVQIDAQGNAAANIITGPGIKNVDLGLHKEFALIERWKLQFRAEVFNALNHPNFIGPSGNFFVSSPTGGRLTRALDNRDIQLALKLIF